MGKSKTAKPRKVINKFADEIREICSMRAANDATLAKAIACHTALEGNCIKRDKSIWSELTKYYKLPKTKKHEVNFDDDGNAFLTEHEEANAS